MKLFDHQSKGVEFLVKNHGVGALYWDMGTGKTLAALKTYECLKALNGMRKLLVICPISLIESAWIDDISKFTTLTFENLRESTEFKADVLLINYEAIISRKFNPVFKKILELRPMCVLDESQKIKTYNAQITKELIKAAPYFPYKILMSATPAPNTESEYWSQMCFLSERILGDNFFKFRNKYMALIRGKTVVPLFGMSKRDIMTMLQRGYIMDIQPGRKTELINRIKPFCQFIEKREVLDLPEEVNVTRFVHMTEEQDRLYNEMWDNLVMEINDSVVTVVNALSKLMKVRQITGGFAYLEGKPAAEIKDNPKLKELSDVIEQIGNKSVIIFCQYKWEIETISRTFGDRAQCLYSETRDPGQVIENFKRRKDGILVAHPASGGVGLSFNECDYMVFYSLSYSFMEYYQARGRIMRAEKKNKATYIHLIAKDSIDEIIMGALLRKEDNFTLFKDLLRHERKQNTTQHLKLS